MKSSVDIHVVLSTYEDMEDFHDDPDEASERLNFILHAVYDNAEEDIETQRLEQILHYAWESWQQDKHLFCLLYTSPSPRDRTRSRMPSSA